MPRTPGKRNSPLPLARGFYDRSVATVARELIGKLVIRDVDCARLVGRIVEAEAYLAEGDSACHSHRGRTRRN
ncbi:MAG: DNA-3-methyladenine glycosylase, partial [Phycisphaerae bacterium]|nr:DNA-3-methyladenine glycosylase [Phycisphaerae bacterium]